MSDKKKKEFSAQSTSELIVRAIFYLIPKKWVQLLPWIIPLTTALFFTLYANGIVYRISMIRDLIDAILVFSVGYLAIILAVYTIFYNGLSDEFVRKMNETKYGDTEDNYLLEYLKVYEYSAVLYSAIIFLSLIVLALTYIFPKEIIFVANYRFLGYKFISFTLIIVIVRIFEQSIYIITNSLKLFHIAIQFKIHNRSK